MCEVHSKSVPQDLVLQEITTITGKNLLYRKFKESVKTLCTKGLLFQDDDKLGLTSTGRQLGALCFAESRLDYPVIESCMEANLLQQIDLLFPEVPSSPPLNETSNLLSPNAISSNPSSPNPSSPPTTPPSSPSPPLSPPPPLSLPRVLWPLSPPPPNQRFGEFVDAQPEPPKPPRNPQPVEGSEEDWEVTLVLDSREVRTLQDRAFLQNRLQQVGVTCDVRAIALGDMQWVLRSRSGQEIMLSTIVERKNMRDLAMSIVDGRFNEQQFRLVQCECQHPVYLVEGGLRSQDMISVDSLQKGIMKTVVNRNIYVYMSTSIDDTVVFLKELHERVCDSVHRYFQCGDE